MNKKMLAIAFAGSLILASCAKKEVETESNVMLAEPEVTETDSTAANAVAAPSATLETETPATTDSAAVAK